MQLNDNLVHQRMRCFMAYNASSCFGINYIIYDLLPHHVLYCSSLRLSSYSRRLMTTISASYPSSPAVNDAFTLIQPFSCCVFIPSVMRLIVHSLPKSFRYGSYYGTLSITCLRERTCHPLPASLLFHSACRKASPLCMP